MAIRLIVLVTLFAAVAGGSSAAPGSFPGQNGVIAFDAVVAQRRRPAAPFRSSRSPQPERGLKQLTQTGGAVWNQDPAFSANGAKIYFTSDDRSTTNPDRIYSMNANGSGRQGVAVGVWPVGEPEPARRWQ